MRTPPYLKQGDTIGIMAPARKISKKEIAPAIKIIESWGFKVKLGKNLFKSHNQFAGTDEQRANDLQTMLDDKSIKAIVCARGGYGTLRIIDKIDFTKFKKNPKWIIGYSDITVLHSHIHNLGIETIHGTMPVSFTKDNESINCLKYILLGEEMALGSRKNIKLNRIGTGTGEVVGGNLSLLYAQIGGPSDINTEGKILFIEDIDEYLYHVDRMMLGLKRAGKLSKLKGLIVGSMIDMKDNSIPYGKTVEQIIFDAVKEYKYPLSFNFPAGHGDQNFPIILGRKSILKILKYGTILIQ